jgi:hypothetical protein
MDFSGLLLGCGDLAFQIVAVDSELGTALLDVADEARVEVVRQFEPVENLVGYCLAEVGLLGHSPVSAHRGLLAGPARRSRRSGEHRAPGRRGLPERRS